MNAKAKEIALRIENDAFDPWTMNKEQKQYMGAFDLDEAESIIAEALAEKDKEIARQWISTKDRLPEDGQVVAFIIDPSIDYYGGSVCVGHFRIEHYGERSIPGFGTWGLGGLHASYWMPLPKVPESSPLPPDEKKAERGCATCGLDRLTQDNAHACDSETTCMNFDKWEPPDAKEVER